MRKPTLWVGNPTDSESVRQGQKRTRHGRFQGRHRSGHRRFETRTCATPIRCDICFSNSRWQDVEGSKPETVPHQSAVTSTAYIRGAAEAVTSTACNEVFGRIRSDDIPDSKVGKDGRGARPSSAASICSAAGLGC